MIQEVKNGAFFLSVGKSLRFLSLTLTIRVCCKVISFVSSWTENYFILNWNLRRNSTEVQHMESVTKLAI